MLPNEVEMNELDKLLEKASGIFMRWRFKMTPSDRAEYPSVFESVNKAERAMLDISNALTVISTELGFSVMGREPGVSILHERWRRNVGEAWPPPDEQVPGRLFPQTYSDWVNLAEDIKDKYPDDPVMRASVNYQLDIVLRAEGGEDVAKRWLAERAGELGLGG